jgi:prepilin-type processing-associated H-X9-DG protein
VNNLKQMHLAAILYNEDNAGYYPLGVIRINTPPSGQQIITPTWYAAMADYTGDGRREQVTAAQRGRTFTGSGVNQEMTAFGASTPFTCPVARGLTTEQGYNPLAMAGQDVDYAISAVPAGTDWSNGWWKPGPVRAFAEPAGTFMLRDAVSMSQGLMQPEVATYVTTPGRVKNGHRHDYTANYVFYDGHAETGWTIDRSWETLRKLIVGTAAEKNEGRIFWYGR